MPTTRCGLGLFAAVLVGCSGGDKGDDGGSTIVPIDDTTDPDDTGVTTDTATGGGVFIDATYFAVVGRFGFDPDVQMQVEYAEPGEGFSPLQVAVVLIDSSIATSGVLDASNSCEVQMDVPGPVAVAPWAASIGAYAAFDVPSDADVRDRCKDYGLPSAFEGDARAQVKKWSWGVGVRELPDIVRDTLAQQLPPSEWATLENYIVGGIAATDAFVGPYGGTASDQGYTIGNEVDGNFEIVVGGTGDTVPIPAEDVLLETGGLARGYYEVWVGPFGSGALTADPPAR
jgi:hypothetical protein